MPTLGEQLDSRQPLKQLADTLPWSELERFRRRAAIAPVISHLKHQDRLLRCCLKGFGGDQLNLLLAAAAWNLKKWLRPAAYFCLQLFGLIAPPQTHALLSVHP